MGKKISVLLTFFIIFSSFTQYYSFLFSSTKEKSQFKPASGNSSTYVATVKASEVVDTTNPTLRDSIIHISNISDKTLDLSWTTAEDDVSAQTSLVYKVVRSADDNINTLNDAATNGTVVMDWSSNVTSTSATSLIPNSTYYFNVIVKDEAGNETLYTRLQQNTLIGARAQFSGLNGTELFLGGNYIELGISNWGDFGTEGNKPASFRGTFNGEINSSGGSNLIGMSADHDGFNNGRDLPIDYYLPGTREERFAVGYKVGDTTYKNTNSAQMNAKNMPTTVENLSNITTGQLKAKIISTWNGIMEITQVISFGVNDKFYRNEVTLKNISGQAWDGARYLRNFDPDNTQFRGGPYNTKNTVTRTIGIDGKAVVKAETYSTTDPLYLAFGTSAPIFFYSKDPKSVASIYTSLTNTNPYDPLAYDAPRPRDYTVSSDVGIMMTWDSGALNANESKTFTYYTSLDERDFDDVEGEIVVADIQEDIQDVSTIDDVRNVKEKIDTETTLTPEKKAEFKSSLTDEVCEYPPSKDIPIRDSEDILLMKDLINESDKSASEKDDDRLRLIEKSIEDIGELAETDEIALFGVIGDIEEATKKSIGNTKLNDATTYYTVTYHGNENTGGAVPTDPQTYRKSESITLLGNTNNLVKSGYTFNGWNTAADGSGGFYSSGDTTTMNSEDIFFYAQWISVPEAGDDTAATDEDESIVIDVTSNDTDAKTPVASLVVSSTATPGHGTVINHHNGTITYAPDLDWSGIDSFTYTVENQDGMTDTGTVVVTVNPVNDIPTKPGDILISGKDPYKREDEVTITWSHSVDVDGDTVQYTLDYYNGTSWINIGSGITAATKDFMIPDINTTNAKVRVKASDGSGSSDYLKSSVFAIDNVPPQANATLSSRDWDSTDAATAITFGDSVGIDKIYYEITQSTDSPEVYNDYVQEDVSNECRITSVEQTVTLNREGENYIHYKIIDMVGNEEIGTFGSYRIDKTNPEGVTLSTKAVGESFIERALNTLTFGIFFKEQIQVKISVQDAISEIGQIWYQKDGEVPYQAKEAGWTKIDGCDEITFTIDPDFKGIIYAAAVDLAGNRGDTVHTHIMTEDNLPVLEVLSESANTWRDTGIDFTVHAGEGQTSSGIKEVRYDTGKGEHGVLTPNSDGDTDKTNDVICGKSFTITENGSYDITMIAEDNAGNRTTVVRSVKIDSIKPDIVVTPPVGFNNDTWYDQDISFNFSKSTKNLSIVKYQYSADDGVTWIDTNEALSHTFTMNTNGSYIFRSISGAGIASEPSDIYQVKIDKKVPMITGVDENGSYYFGRRINFTDELGELASSTENKKKIANHAWIEGIGKHSIMVRDKAGNTATMTFTIKEIPYGINSIKMADKDGLDDVQKLFDAYKNNMPKDVAEDYKNILHALGDKITNLKLEIGGFQSLMERLPNIDQVKITDEDAISEAFDVYQGLTIEQKSSVTRSKEKLDGLKEKISALKKEAREVEDMINDLPSISELTIVDAHQVFVVYARYGALREDQKEYVSKEARTRLTESAVEIQKLLLVDEATQTSVEGIDGTTFDPDVYLVVDRIVHGQENQEGSEVYQTFLKQARQSVRDNMTGKELVEVYDIHLMKGNVKTQPDGKIKVRIKIPDEYKDREGLNIVHISPEGELTPMHATITEDGYLEFITDHFSYYGIIAKPLYSWWWLLFIAAIIIGWFIIKNRKNHSKTLLEEVS
ncbi:MAG: Ig-like domain-containing protein [Eubacteriales bacterium]